MKIKKYAPCGKHGAAGEENLRAAISSVAHSTSPALACQSPAEKFSVTRQYQTWLAQARRNGHDRLAAYLLARLILRGGE